MNARTLVATAFAAVPSLASAQEVTTATAAAVDDGAAALLASMMSIEDDSGPSLRFYGFSDFSAAAILFGDDTKWSSVANDNAGFYIGNLNLYLDADLTSGFRSLIEVRFLFTPNGTNTSEQDALLDPTVNHRIQGTSDPSDVGRYANWGGIGIERAYIEYTLHSLVRIRLGRFLTPWGIWNVDHGSPVIVGFVKPYIIGEDLFPRAQTGGEIFGSYGFGSTTLGYHLTFSNGRGPLEQYADLDANKAVGGRLWLTGRWLGELTIGASGFWSTYSDERMQIDIAQPDPLPQRFLWERYEEVSLAADVRFEHGPLLVQAEVALRDRVWNDAARGTDLTGAVVSDHRAWGGYLLLAYTLPWWNLRPYSQVEYYNTGRADGIVGSRDVTGPTIGLNIRIIPSVVFKASYSYAWFLNPRPGSVTDDPVHLLGSQLSWAF